MSLLLHCGAEECTRDDLKVIEAPKGTDTWFPVKHADVLDAVETNLSNLNYEITKSWYAVADRGKSFFGVLDIKSEILEGVTLSVGVRNANNRRFPMSLTVGHRVFVCDNLAFSGEITINKKHTKFGHKRYKEGITNAISQLGQFKTQEAERIEGLKAKDLSKQQADSIILQSFEKKLVGTRLLPKLIEEWRNPSHEEYKPRNSWSLLNCFTEVVKPRFKQYPQRAAHEMMEFQALCL